MNWLIGIVMRGRATRSRTQRNKKIQRRRCLLYVNIWRISRVLESIAISDFSILKLTVRYDIRCSIFTCQRGCVLQHETRALETSRPNPMIRPFQLRILAMNGLLLLYFRLIALYFSLMSIFIYYILLLCCCAWGSSHMITEHTTHVDIHKWTTWIFNTNKSFLLDDSIDRAPAICENEYSN